MNHIRKTIPLLIILCLISNTAIAVSEVTINDAKKPHGAILFIIDGFGSSYYYPEFTPIALDGTELIKARTQNISFGSRILDIRTPHPVTGIAHSIIVTGFSQANEETVGFPDATIFDITKRFGYVNLAVMETGDFVNMRNEQDAILFAENNSIENPVISMEAKAAPSGIYELMYDWKMKIPEYLVNRSGEMRYSAFNKWGIDAANAIATSMIRNNPSQKFLLIMNVGEVDSGGHNLGDDDYVRLIEDFDRDIYPLYQTAKENDIALFLTADHGMSFAEKDARRGGHSSDKYSTRLESLRIPFVIYSPNIESGIVKGEYGQEDIAPTLLSVLDLPNDLQYTDGSTINIKKYASIFVKSKSEYKISLWTGDQKVSERQDSELVFTGLPLKTNYTLKADGEKGSFEEDLFLDSDKHLDLNRPEPVLNIRMIIAIILISIVNIAGLMIIRRIKK
ncbi:MAG: sulfatase-like hydrolase/transferase [Candidatus Methanoperedens sp.]|nr:sulfatase-like hydrolase/transferase [Candidatus Methanoperedens sp.]